MASMGHPLPTVPRQEANLGAVTPVGGGSSREWEIVWQVGGTTEDAGAFCGLALCARSASPARSGADTMILLTGPIPATAKLVAHTGLGPQVSTRSR